MPATITIKEIFPLSTSEESLNEEIKLRLKAGAIRSWIEKTHEALLLFTEWNIIGEQ